MKMLNTNCIQNIYEVTFEFSLFYFLEKISKFKIYIELILNESIIEFDHFFNIQM